jgi:hypothetical protein
LRSFDLSPPPTAYRLSGSSTEPELLTANTRD